MDRVPVSSSNVVSIGYEANTQTLEVEFKSNAVYQYFGVPQQVHENFMNSGSKGQFLQQYIRNVYPTSKVG